MRRMYSRSQIEKIIDEHGGGGGGAVASVNGKTGVVILNGNDIKWSTTSQETVGSAIGVDRLDISNLKSGKENKLTAGPNITITRLGPDTIISAAGGSGGSYTAGYGIDISSNNVISVDNDIASVSYVESQISDVDSRKQDVINQNNALSADFVVANNTQTVQENLERIDLEVEGCVDDIADLQESKLDASKTAISDIGALVVPNSAPASPKLVSIDTNNAEALINVGSGLQLQDGTLSATTGTHLYRHNICIKDTTDTVYFTLINDRWTSYAESFAALRYALPAFGSSADYADTIPLVTATGLTTGGKIAVGVGNNSNVYIEVRYIDGNSFNHYPMSQSSTTIYDTVTQLF